MADQRERQRVWDVGLQPERTSLAWRRLGLLILGAAALSVKLAWPLLGVWAAGVGGGLAVGAVALLGYERRRYLSLHRQLVSGATVRSGGGLVLGVSVLALLLGLLGLLLVLLG